MNVSLRSLFPDGQILGASDVGVTAVTDRAADVRPGTLFVAIRGAQHNGEDFVDEAIARGACGILLSEPRAELAVAQCVVPNVRGAFGRICSALLDDPATKLKVVGVTGTNGKTTTTWLLRSILRHAGERCGLLGTIEYHDGIANESAALTTPDSPTLWRWMRRMAEADADYAAIELSSHALNQDRAAGLSLAAAIVTNVTHDHLDYHRTFEAYWHSKSRIFELLRTDGAAIVNLDDPGSAWMAMRVPPGHRCLTLSVDGSADVTATQISSTIESTRFQLHSPWGEGVCRLPLIGRHNVSNALGAAAAALTLGLSLEQVVAGLEAFEGVPGRLEAIDVGQSFAVFVDYAHTDDALARCLRTLRPLTAGRLICVFGAGGDRDRGKRPKLGGAALLADQAIITSDNPRSEDPQQIADQILAGMSTAAEVPLVELNRERAIRRALSEALPGDCVLIAGKGHEQEQIIGTVRRPFDDRVVARRCLIEICGRPRDQRISA